MLALVRNINNLIEPLRKLSTCIGVPALDLVIRVFAANIFFWSGWQKFQNYLNGSWDTTVYLFREVHIVPLVSPDIAAIAGTAAEITLPALLILGLFTRFASAGLLILTITIEFFVVDAFGDALSNPDHYFWMIILAIPLIYGPKIISADHWIVKLLQK